MTNTNFPKATIEGYPRVGANRELKRALESYWAGRIDAETFESAAHSLRLDTYNRLRDLGLTEDYAIPADVAYYDQVLETALTVGAVAGETLDDEFTLARGNKDTAPLEMTKWFDTNYHYIVPEIADDQDFKARPQRVIKRVEEARAAGHTVRPYLVGPVTLLALSKQAEGATKSPLDRLDDAVKAYQEVLAELDKSGVKWVQLAEPALVADLTIANDEELAAHTKRAYEAILGADNRPQVYLTTPYGSARKGLDVLAELKPEAVQVDLSVGTLALDEGYLDRVKNLKSHVVAGLIDGRNVWAANLRDLRSKYEDLEGSLDSLSVSTSVSLQHVPHTVEAETKLPADVATWFLSLIHI